MPAVIRDGRFRLIETAAERVAERLLADHPVSWLRVEVRKPIRDGYTAAVTMLACRFRWVWRPAFAVLDAADL
ncbi:MAG: dihydroneopterin aldolase [Streptosporangiaceae bacterium]